MKTNRKNFIKLAGMAGLGTAGITLLPACRSGTENETGQLTKNWSEDPEWRKVRYGDWGGPGVSDGPGPMDPVRLKDYAPRSSVVAEETTITNARYPVIDAHIHIYNFPEPVEGKSPEEVVADYVETMDQVGVQLSVVLTGATGEEFDRLVDLYPATYPDRFQLYCGVEMEGIDEPDYPDRAVAELERCYEQGARGIGEVSDKGFGITGDPELAADERLHFDDPRLEPFWGKAAELNMPANIHIADHPSAWEPPDLYQERTPVFQQFNQHDGTGLPFDDLLDILPRTLEKHPDTTFIACHLANLGHDLGRLAEMMDRHENLYVDISARDYEIGRTPRAAARFFTEYRNRVLFGTDMGMEKSMYRAWWRLLESADEFMPGRIWWPYYGLALSDEVLESLYRENAARIMNWEEV